MYFFNTKDSSALPDDKNMGSAGFDLKSDVDISLKSGDSVSVVLPSILPVIDGYVGIIETRSGITLKNGILAGGDAIFKRDDETEYHMGSVVNLLNTSNSDWNNKKGSPFVQLIYHKLATVDEVAENCELDSTEVGNISPLTFSNSVKEVASDIISLGYEVNSRLYKVLENRWFKMDSIGYRIELSRGIRSEFAAHYVSINLDEKKIFLYIPDFAKKKPEFLSWLNYNKNLGIIFVVKTKPISVSYEEHERMQTEYSITIMCASSKTTQYYSVGSGTTFLLEDNQDRPSSNGKIINSASSIRVYGTGLYSYVGNPTGLEANTYIKLESCIEYVKDKPVVNSLLGDEVAEASKSLSYGAGMVPTGTIDAGYTGQIYLLILNKSIEQYLSNLIAFKAVAYEVLKFKAVGVDVESDVTQSVRNDNGFGSSTRAIEADKE